MYDAQPFSKEYMSFFVLREAGAAETAFLCRCIGLSWTAAAKGESEGTA